MFVEHYFHRIQFAHDFVQFQVCPEKRPVSAPLPGSIQYTFQQRSPECPKAPDPGFVAISKSNWTEPFKLNKLTTAWQSRVNDFVTLFLPESRVVETCQIVARHRKHYNKDTIHVDSENAYPTINFTS